MLAECVSTSVRAMMGGEAERELAANAPVDLETELGRLKEEHRDLDTAIEALKLGVACDQLQVQRLKKRKLVLRDRISHIEDQLHPDIIA